MLKTVIDRHSQHINASSVQPCTADTAGPLQGSLPRIFLIDMSLGDEMNSYCCQSHDRTHKSVGARRYYKISTKKKQQVDGLKDVPAGSSGIKIASGLAAHRNAVDPGIWGSETYRGRASATVWWIVWPNKVRIIRVSAIRGLVGKTVSVSRLPSHAKGRLTIDCFG